MLDSSGDAGSTFKLLIFAVVILILLPYFVAVFTPSYLGDVDRSEVLDSYEEMTGRVVTPKTSVWVLTGIYTPYSGGNYGYTEDGWLFGSEITSYTPTQYLTSPERFTVYKDSNGVFRYFSSDDYDPVTGTGHRGQEVDDDGKVTYPGDIYNAVSFDVLKKSSIFFSEGTRTEQEGHFYFAYDGYRMAFQPISNYTTANQDGQRIPVIATTTSLSLIWYGYYDISSGLAGNLILSGNQSGVAYLTAAEIVSAFNSNTSTASFKMVFNGVPMDIHIRMSPQYLMSHTVEQCYNDGFWSVMVASESADGSAYIGTDFSVSPQKMLKTVIDLFTFNFSDYNFSGWTMTLCAIIFGAVFYVSLITLCLQNAYLWILLALVAALQSGGIISMLLG